MMVMILSVFVDTSAYQSDGPVFLLLWSLIVPHLCQIQHSYVLTCCSQLRC